MKPGLLVIVLLSSSGGHVDYSFRIHQHDTQTKQLVRMRRISPESSSDRKQIEV